jgi:hypothetical protein
MSGLVRSTLGGLGVAALALALVWQQRATATQVAQLTAQVEQLGKQLAAQPRPRVPLTPPPAPVDAEAIAVRAARLARAPEAGAPETAAPAQAPMPSPPPLETAPEPVHVPEEAQAVLAAAIGRGRLASEDVRSLRAQLEHATRQQQHEVGRQIAVAINTGKLVPDDRRVLFP